jgi:hypothetical protein
VCCSALDHDTAPYLQCGDYILRNICVIVAVVLLLLTTEPFIGSHYDNIFIHYKPVSGWDYNWL